ncbi:MAG: PP2C family protein-serine/threonine phosphatase [Lachnospiraceae bacterium]|nr:PP2C family protein-serine/threonine phosphatase [Lachnospiraceae bacterium]
MSRIRRFAEKHNRRFRVAGMIWAALLAVCGFYMVIKRVGTPEMDAISLFNAGVDILGAAVCAVLYFGCIGEKEDTEDETTRSLAVLILLTEIAFFLNETTWILHGNPERRFLNLTGYVAVGIVYTLLTFYFWRFIRNAMDLKGKLDSWLDAATVVLLFPAQLILLLNLVWPICFRVTEAGIYETLPLHWLGNLYMELMTFLVVIALLRSGATRKQKASAISFVVIPLAHYILSGGAENYATQYGSVLVAVILMYTILFSDRSRRLYLTKSELQTATVIQEAMLPSIFPAYPDRKEFDIYASMTPAKEVGGDFYDFFLVDDDHLALVMADVAGKGVPAALYMMIAKILIKNRIQGGDSPGAALRNVNHQLLEGSSTEMFVTVWLAVLEISTGRVTVVNAGHEHPALRRAGGQYELIKYRHSPAVGTVEGITFREHEVQLMPGDSLFVYTDGVPEATDQDLKLFGTDRMLDALNSEPDADAETILKNVAAGIDAYVAGAEQFDDITMMCIRYKGPVKAE